MSETLATYNFLPWLRQGLSNNITQRDDDISVKLRASITVNLEVTGLKPDGKPLQVDDRIQKKVNLYGPGDVVGIKPNAITKVEPQDQITNFEPNYLPYIDFYEEDLPWRYTPAKPDTSNDRLRPWITLVVLKEDEFDTISNNNEQPLPHIKLKDGKKPSIIFPKPDELWAWAHVHINQDLSNGLPLAQINPVAVSNNLKDLLNKQPDLAHSRIICPRKLENNIGYHAFLIPSFESGRLAGLGLEFPMETKPDGTKTNALIATESAWKDDNRIEFPYYHRWYFRTGSVGDFEYLVNLLEPRPADKSVGVRNIDVTHIGSNFLPINDLGGILKLGGALRVPSDTLKPEDKAEFEVYENWDKTVTSEFANQMAARINLGDEYINKDSDKSIEEINKSADIVIENQEGDPDPMITSPMYGRWHALQQRLLKDAFGNELNHTANPKDNWISKLNLDPRFRVAAGLGTKVIQKNQELYMNSAWEQVGEIVEANTKIRLAQMAKEVSESWYARHLLPLFPEKSIVFVAPVHRRVIYKNLTVAKQIEESVVPSVLFSGVFRSIVRPRGAFMKRLKSTIPDGIFKDNLIERINEGEIEVVPPKTDPKGAINLSNVVDAIKPKNVPQFIEKPLLKYKWFKFLPLFLLLLLLILFYFHIIVSISFLTVAFTILIGLYVLLNNLSNKLSNAAMASQDSQKPELVDLYPKISNFQISDFNSPNSYVPQVGLEDSAVGKRFKAALKDAFSIVDADFPQPIKNKLDLEGIADKLKLALNPTLVIPKRTYQSMDLPEILSANMVEDFAPIMVYPEFDVPMYQPLKEISAELFLPNINKIEQNSITLLENNQRFIESYMVGINHEMSRELLWREFPTDQRGTYFRQFWETNSFLNKAVETRQELQERFEKVLEKRQISKLQFYYDKLIDTTLVIDENFLSEATKIISKEELRDIIPINLWTKTDTRKLIPSDSASIKKYELGAHNQRAETSGKTQLVLVIRGELLKKYPTAIIYAQKAKWGVDADGNQDVNVERVLDDLEKSEKKEPPPTKIKTPLFEAKIEPEIYFFGFDLDDEEAKGTPNPQSVTDDAGWFFVLKERPGEPRFGLDIEKAKSSEGNERIINWNNLSWKDIGTADGNCIDVSKTTITFNESQEGGEDQENKPNSEDKQAIWNNSTNSAQLAYILYQVPVMVAVHASRMLKKTT